jgi:hypothetical protein
MNESPCERRWERETNLHTLNICCHVCFRLKGCKLQCEGWNALKTSKCRELGSTSCFRLCTLNDGLLDVRRENKFTWLHPVCRLIARICFPVGAPAGGVRLNLPGGGRVSVLLHRNCVCAPIEPAKVNPLRRCDT